MTASHRKIREQFATICVHYGLSDKLELRSYMPKSLIHYQVVDAAGNPLTEYIIGAQMKQYLKGLGEGLRMAINATGITPEGFRTHMKNSN